jgi:hypothetical protein
VGGSGSQVRGATVTYLGRIGRVLRSPVVQFGLSGRLAVVIVALVAAVLFDHEATSEALRDAENTTQVTGSGIIAPALTPAFLAGRPAALRRMNAIVHRRVLLAPVVRVKIWRSDGTILYSDESRLIGERYHLGDEEQTARRGRSIDAEVRDLQRPENRFGVAAHANASEVRVSVTAEPPSDAVLVVVADNGDGFDLVDDDRPRFGLRMLEDLASHSGGRLELDARSGHGTTVRLTVPGWG